MNEEFLAPTYFIDSDHPEIQAFAANAVGDAQTPKEKAIRLYYAVRDGIYYDPYRMEPGKEPLKASSILRRGYGHCVAKAIVLAAVLRAQGIPSRLHFADVRNHLTTKRLRDLMETDMFYHHGYNDVFLDGKWIKVTPTFNLSLCQKMNVKPLDFDGENDAIFHPMDLEGRRHMEYITDHGSYADVPFEQMLQAFMVHYGSVALKWSMQKGHDGDFDREAQMENTGKDT